eukprot:2711422-Pyramimonas_sp.AAC.1
MESTVGKVQFPKRDSGLCLEADYDLLRLRPGRTRSCERQITFFRGSANGGMVRLSPQESLRPRAMLRNQESRYRSEHGPQRTQSVCGINFQITGTPGR